MVLKIDPEHPQRKLKFSKKSDSEHRNILDHI